MRFVLAIACSAACLSAQSCATDLEPLRRLSLSYQTLARRVDPAVVQIEIGRAHV